MPQAENAGRLNMIDEKRLTDTFQKLVSIDAESYHERNMADYLKTRLKELGLSVYEDHSAETLGKKTDEKDKDPAGNLYAVLKGNLNTEPLLFVGHTDTVHPGKGRKTILHDDGRITSDGTTVLGADDEAALAEILELITVIKEDQIPHPDLEFFFPAAEEPYAQGSRIFDYSKVQAKTAFVLDLAGKVGGAAVAAPSIISFDITVHGKSAHAGFAPESGVHAIKIAAKAISNIPQGHIDEETTVNIGTISGGTAMNIVPDEVKLSGEIRSLSNEKAKQQMDVVRTAFEQAAGEEGGSADVRSDVCFSAYRISEEEAAPQRWKAACQKAGVEPYFVDTFGGSDNNHLAEHGIRGIVAACAYENAHTVREYTWVDGMKKTTEILLNIVSEQ